MNVFDFQLQQNNTTYTGLQIFYTSIYVKYYDNFNPAEYESDFCFLHHLQFFLEMLSSAINVHYIATLEEL